jgi:hypothetical protein
MFDVWNAAEEINPNGVHHLVTQGFQYGNDESYSIRWTGQIEAHYTTNHQIRFDATGKYRVYLDDGGGEDLIIDMWATSNPSPGPTTSASIPLTAGTKYNIRIEMSNLSTGAQGAVLTWKTSQMSDFQIIPQSQLFEPTSNTAPVAHAGNDQTITLPTSTANLDAQLSDDVDGTIADYTWTKFSGPATYTITNDDLETTTATGLVAGTYVFRVTVTDDDGSTDTDDVTITVNPANSLPTVAVSADQDITLPDDDVSITSNGGVDSDGTIASYLWTKASGPTTYTITTPTTQNTTITGLVQGTYVFTLTVTDDDGGTGFDQIQITVHPEVANDPPVADAGDDQIIKLPVSAVVLSGSGTDDGIILGQTWSQVSGPNTASFSTPAAMETVASGLIAGTYIFRITIRDNGLDDGLTGYDEVQVKVDKSYKIFKRGRNRTYID